MSTAVNEIILKYQKVHAYYINKNCYQTFYKPDSITEYLQEKNINKKIRDYFDDVNVVIPAAGLGSRFSKACWKAPKPLIDINGKHCVHRQ